MPQPLNAVRNEQWDECGRCGRLFPMSQLVKQKGMVVCPDDYDNLDIERRPLVIAKVLQSGAAVDQEGSDRRYLERMYFDDYDQLVGGGG